jgi:hypothetical protein
MSKYLAESEIMLDLINNTDFSIESMAVFDKHMKLATQVATDSIYSMYTADVIEIEKTGKESFFGKLFSLKKNVVRKGQQKVEQAHCGFFEDILLHELEHADSLDLDDWLKNAFKVIFKSVYTHVNPGKHFLHYGLVNQRIGLFTYEIYKKLLSKKIKITQTEEQRALFKQIQFQTIDGITQNPDVRKAIEERVKFEFERYKPTQSPLTE